MDLTNAIMPFFSIDPSFTEWVKVTSMLTYVLPSVYAIAEEFQVHDVIYIRVRQSNRLPAPT
jgi:hypothetical protein